LAATVLTTIAAALSGGTQPELPGFLNSLASPLEHYGLWAILVLVLIEDFGIPVPGETVLIAGAVLAGYGRLNIVAVGVIGFLAAVVGDNIGYAIGRFGGRAVVERWGRYVFITKERLDKAEDFFNRHGGKIIAIARFVEGLRQANGLIAGITEMRWLKFLAFNALGAALWVGTWVSIGYFAGQHLTTIYNAITEYSLYAAIVAVVVIVAYVAYRVIRKRRLGHVAVPAGAPAAGAPAAGAPADAPADDAPADDAPADAPAADGPTADRAAADHPAADHPATGDATTGDATTGDAATGDSATPTATPGSNGPTGTVTPNGSAGAPRPGGPTGPDEPAETHDHR
jgi:membrane protein DedA with SNARE-associated domain